MPTSPTGILSLAQDYLRTMLADCEQVQRFLNSGSAANALLRIHQDVLTAPADGNAYGLAEIQALRPFIIVSTAAESGFTREMLARGAGSSHYSDSGNLELHMEQGVPDDLAGQADEAESYFYNQIGLIVEDLRERALQGGFLAIKEIAIEEGPSRTHPDQVNDVGDAFWCRIRVGYE